jgi:hypothetical protein
MNDVWKPRTIFSRKLINSLNGFVYTHSYNKLLLKKKKNPFYTLPIVVEVMSLTKLKTAKINGNFSRLILSETSNDF